MRDKSAVLVDTSVWIDYFRGGSATISETVDDLIADDLARICGVILAELIQGAKSAKEMEALAEVGHTIRQLLEPPGLWEKTGRLAYDLRKKGKTIHLIDCYLAELADENRCRLFSLDQHFKVISEVRPLPLFEFSGRQ